MASSLKVNLEFVDQSRNVLFRKSLGASSSDEGTLNVLQAVSGLNTEGDKKATRINKLIHKLLSHVHASHDDTSDENHIFHNPYS